MVSGACVLVLIVVWLRFFGPDFSVSDSEHAISANIADLLDSIKKKVSQFPTLDSPGGNTTPVAPSGNELEKQGENDILDSYGGEGIQP